MKKLRLHMRNLLLAMLCLGFALTPCFESAAETFKFNAGDISRDWSKYGNTAENTWYSSEKPDLDITSSVLYLRPNSDVYSGFLWDTVCTSSSTLTTEVGISKAAYNYWSEVESVTLDNDLYVLGIDVSKNASGKLSGYFLVITRSDTNVCNYPGIYVLQNGSFVASNFCSFGNCQDRNRGKSVCYGGTKTCYHYKKLSNGKYDYIGKCTAAHAKKTTESSYYHCFKQADGTNTVSDITSCCYHNTLKNTDTGHFEYHTADCKVLQNCLTGKDYGSQFNNFFPIEGSNNTERAGDWKKVTFSSTHSDTNNDGKTDTVTLTATCGNTTISKSTTTVLKGSPFIGAYSQPIASFKGITFTGTNDPYKIKFCLSKPSNMWDSTWNTRYLSMASKNANAYSNGYATAIGALATTTITGWHTNANTNGGWYYNGSTEITSNMIYRYNYDINVYPAWSPNHYNITYSAPKPATASTNVSGSTASYYCTYDASYTLPNTGYTLPGYKCNSGWKYSNGRDVGTSQVSNLTATDGATVALHHTWAPRTYTANYNINKPTYATSSSGSTAATIHTFDSYNNLATNGFSCDGATFLGWSRNTSAKEFNNAQSVKNLMTPTADGQSVNMYAIWRPIQYYVRFNRNWDNDAYITGNTSVTKGKFDYGTAYSAIKQSDTNMSRQGYYIAYWTEKADGTGRRYYCGDKDWPAGKNNVEATFSNLTKTDGATVDLYAHWEPIPYTLVYHKNDSNGGTNPAGGNSASYAETTVRYYNDTKPLLANKWTRVNELNVPSVFRGWNLPADVDSTDNSVKYTARWSNTGNFVNGDSCTLCTTRDGTVDIYTVWDDVPVLVAQDYEIPYSTNSGDTIGDLVSRDSDGGLVLSQTALEEILLKNAVSKHSDREDGELELGEHFFIKYFSKDTYTDLDSPTSFEVKYTVTDSTGNSYTQSAMLYGGYLIRIDIQ